MRGLKGKVAIVSGAGSGIGLATARRLSDEGCIVTGGIFSETQRGALGEIEGELLDVRSEADWRRVVAAVVARQGRLDILVNVAGISRNGTAEETTAQIWDEVMSANLASVLNGSKAALPHLKRNGGAIVSVASINALRGNTGMAAYCASKFGVAGLTMSMAIDYAPYKVRVNCVCPGTIDTGMIREHLDNAKDRAAMLSALVAKHPLGRIGQAEEIAAAIAFLASDDASYITGVALPVDGGRSAR
jgi:NAD(P)-dependent dehydrogenase (short-subunit alcohol dehydrogenase family)